MNANIGSVMGPRYGRHMSGATHTRRSEAGELVGDGISALITPLNIGLAHVVA